MLGQDVAFVVGVLAGHVSCVGRSVYSSIRCCVDFVREIVVSRRAAAFHSSESSCLGSWSVTVPTLPSESGHPVCAGRYEPSGFSDFVARTPPADPRPGTPAHIQLSVGGRERPTGRKVNPRRSRPRYSDRVYPTRSAYLGRNPGPGTTVGCRTRNHFSEGFDASRGLLHVVARFRWSTRRRHRWLRHCCHSRRNRDISTKPSPAVRSASPTRASPRRGVIGDRGVLPYDVEVGLRLGDVQYRPL